MTIAGYETHPAADLFPMLEGDELRALADDIKAHGLLNPVVLFAEGGKRLVLDGRNRLRACEMVGVAPRFEFWTGEGSPTEWVVSQNLHRRHLSTSQRALIAAELVPMFEKEAHARLATSTGGAEPRPRENLPEAEKGRAREKAAQAVNVSDRTVAAAVKVTREAPIEVVAAVRRGDLSVHAAEKQIPPTKIKPLPKRKTSPPPKASPTYSIELVMPTEQATPMIRALKDLGFVPSHDSGSHDLQMVKRAVKRTA
jgi:ParB-like chromosome segregation protein Spo0J